MDKMYGPSLAVSEELHQMKYRSKGESFNESATRVANALKDDEGHFQALREILLDMRFMPAGRVQAAMGAPRQVTPYNCFVSNTIPDSMSGIMKVATEAAETMRLGGGIGYDFSTLRPRGELITSLDSRSSGPVSFMQIFDAICKTISSAGHRRGAQMGVLRVDHPDIEEFIEAKHNRTNLTQFNVSIGVTDEFMNCVLEDRPFALQWGGRVYKTINSRYLWDKIMRSTWKWAEPGVLFIDRINSQNNLWYCETIAATNPCGEQPLPPHGACLLGSFNLTKYVFDHDGFKFDWEQFAADIPVVVRAMDNIVDRAIYPLQEQFVEATSKRRMGLGITGLANAVEALGHPYGSPMFRAYTEDILSVLANECYRASAMIAAEKGAFPLYSKDEFLKSEYLKVLDKTTLDLIEKHGIRNSHLTSIAPTGTISLTADNISSGLEPVYRLSYERTIQTYDGPIKEVVEDYGQRVFGVKGRTANECSAEEHVGVLIAAAKWIDSAISKTCNIGSDVSFDQFKDVYMAAWKGGAKGCTTYRDDGEREGIFADIKPAQEDGTQACRWDPETGIRSCE
jgi:ribonucleoside-diphosphate reductase alpha chain